MSRAEVLITLEDIEHRFRPLRTPENLAKRREQAANRPAGEVAMVAKIGAQVVGFCRITLENGRNQLGALYVLPAFHRQGIGTAFWERVRPDLDPSLPTFVELAVYNQQAAAFYRRLGFVDTGRRMADPRFTMQSGAIIPEMEMCLPPDSA